MKKDNITITKNELEALLWAADKFERINEVIDAEQESTAYIVCMNVIRRLRKKLKDTQELE